MDRIRLKGWIVWDDQKIKNLKQYSIYMVSGNSQNFEKGARISISMENQHPLSFRQVQGLTSILFYHLQQNGKVTHID